MTSFNLLVATEEALRSTSGWLLTRKYSLVLSKPLPERTLVSVKTKIMSGSIELEPDLIFPISSHYCHKWHRTWHCHLPCSLILDGAKPQVHHHWFVDKMLMCIGWKCKKLVFAWQAKSLPLKVEPRFHRRVDDFLGSLTRVVVLNAVHTIPTRM